MTTLYCIDKVLLEMLVRIGADVDGALAASGISGNSPGPYRVSEELFFRFMENIIRKLPSEDAVLRIISIENLGTFSPPSFAAMCGYDGHQFLERLIRYKKSVCPLVFDKEKRGDSIRLSISTGGVIRLPAFLAELETAYVVQLIRTATGKPIRPLNVGLPHSDYPAATGAFFGCPIVVSEVATLDFANEDLSEPFMTYNEGMWDCLRPGLEEQLFNSSRESVFLHRVRETLTRLLPGGHCSLGATAAQLCISSRTLQRRLAEEAITFNDILTDIRKKLALAYLDNPDLTLYDIAYLLGFRETNSFLRAFRQWEGKSASTFRKGNRVSL